MNKVVYVPASFSPNYRGKSVDVPTGEKKRGFFGGEKDVTVTQQVLEEFGESDCCVDGARLENDINKAIEALNQDEYEVVSVTPIASGKYDHMHEKDYNSATGVGWGYGYGYGYSYTSGVIITAKKIA